MPLDPRVKRFLDALNASGPVDTLESTVDQRRVGLAELMRFGGRAPMVARCEEIAIPSAADMIPLRIYVPPAERPNAGALVYFHGGGLVAGSLDTHDGVARSLANHSACRVISVGYRLAPEHGFPAALEDAMAAVDYVRNNAQAVGIHSERIGLCGDSAGATLVAATCHALAGHGRPPLAVQVLLCPILDYSKQSASRRELATGFLVGESTLEHDLLHYLPTGHDPADPRISPLCATDFSGLPRTIIHAAEFDPLRDEAHEYFERLRHAGVQVSYTCHPGMIHLFYGLGGVIPYATTAMARIGAELGEALA